jgi:hypothetical protein
MALAYHLAMLLDERRPGTAASGLTAIVEANLRDIRAERGTPIEGDMAALAASPEYAAPPEDSNIEVLEQGPGILRLRMAARRAGCVGYGFSMFWQGYFRRKSGELTGSPVRVVRQPRGAYYDVELWGHGGVLRFSDFTPYRSTEVQRWLAVRLHAVLEGGGAPGGPSRSFQQTPT